MLPKGPPYAPMAAILGGQPTVPLDVPITSVFLFLFLLGGCGHMTILQLNLRRGHKFPMSGAMFGWSMARILACAMRIAWATHPTNISLAIAAQLFVNLGDLVGFVININLAQRIVRALHPNFGWHPIFKRFLIIVFSLILVSMFLLIGFTVDSFFTLDPTKLHNARDAQLYGVTYFAFTAVLPIPLVLVSLAVHRKTEAERFGNSSLRTKTITILSGATTLALGEWFRAGTSYLTPRPVTDPAPYSSKACFYVFYFCLEILVIWSYLFARIDLIFYVPDGSKGPGDYSRSAMPNKGDNHGEEGVMTGTEQVM